MNERIQLTRYDNGVVVITFNRPDSLNALDLAAMHTFRLTVRKLQHERDLRVVVVTGAGERAFCSGGDLYELAKRRSEADGREMSQLMSDALLTLEQFPCPVIAAINGYALGGGSEIALACDMRIADEKVRMGMVQIRMALTPGWGAGQRLLRGVGYAKALELLLKGEPLRAEELQTLNLVNQIVPEGQALPAALEFAEQIAHAPIDVVHGIKTLLRAGLTETYQGALEVEADLFPALWAAKPHLDAVQAFLERKK